ncbi:tRNA (adenosine(37)-N6)-threonylcarbamoyltransferase complex dimerization subunit type 1 TsaB [Caldibacillus lycopersici]|uniref:tRNA (Adenosine(37)-N6)-threonylcarbamoyltransferase complex dimerization subunit type 1 TsaB n=1 Tax=Perspicuibacillus lycopersici TaxID=1325689 RepID=A0AAE3J0B0_9BACI|nr:tRNA (adenosine(37)-N6)-threonylcarbamoyltransferase complex dimerization subunit type 1 TsaB [Perspicuibacillus lycopersici]MCU9615315.1 tRNA (adenosine(37)-N6)-threonylcarbamoyltransferase complex dimerization subunit type 1 TsaB [Perspicuibacillus lycopersici]
MNILAIDTSTDVLGIGLVSDEKVIGEYITNIKRNHSTRVLPAIEYLLKDCGIQTKDINKIVVAEGPGSYTGLRIGVTIGKTLAWTLKIPLVGVSSLKVMAASGRYFDGYISPIIDARRGNIYTGLYKFENGEIIEVLEDQHISTEDWVLKLNAMEKPILVLGSDVPQHKEIFTVRLNEFACFAPITDNIPRPGELALLGRQLVEENIHSFVPNYTRLAEAEAKWREQNRR